MSERIDNIGFGGLRLIQDPEEFCYGVDAVILADFASRSSSGKPKSIVDLGTGTGIVPLILSHKTDASQIIGVELQTASFARAKKNAQLNGLQDRLRFVNCDVKNAASRAGSLSFMRGNADVVTMNPPYMVNSGGITNFNTAKAIARHETTAGLNDFLVCAAALLKPKGDLFIVHRPSRLADICCFARENHLEPKELCFVSPNVRKAPNIVLVHCVKDGGRELKILDPLFVYDEDGNYTEELRKCYI